MWWSALRLARSGALAGSDQVPESAESPENRPACHPCLQVRSHEELAAQLREGFQTLSVATGGSRPVFAPGTCCIAAFARAVSAVRIAYLLSCCGDAVSSPLQHLTIIDGRKNRSRARRCLANAVFRSAMAPLRPHVRLRVSYFTLQHPTMGAWRLMQGAEAAARYRAAWWRCPTMAAEAEAAAGGDRSLPTGATHRNRQGIRRSRRRRPHLAGRCTTRVTGGRTTTMRRAGRRSGSRLQACERALHQGLSAWVRE